MIRPLASVLLAAGLGSQDMAWSIQGVPGRKIGSNHTAAIGDINGDGHEDLAAIVDGWCGYGQPREWLWLISGRDGTLIREIRCSWVTNVPGWGGAFWRVGAAGDWNDDGTPDYFALGSGVDVRSGIDDSVLFVPQWSGIETIADVDIDGDGEEDFVTGSWSANGGWGEVRVFSHLGKQRYRLLGGTANGHTLAIAQEIASLNDVDGDGCDDFVMGCFEPTGVGAAVVVSGRTGAYLQVCYGTYPNGGIGYVVDSCGDLDGDGAWDFIAGNFGTGFVPVGVVTAFSSRTGAVLHQIVDPQHHDFSKSIASRGADLDGDGVPDIVVGAPNWAFPQHSNLYGAVVAFSGRDGTQLHIHNSMSPGAAFTSLGYWSTVLRPAVGEHLGKSVVLDSTGGVVQILSPTGVLCGQVLGAITAYRGTPRTAAILGQSCSGTLATTPNIGMRNIPGGVRLHLSGAPANSPAILCVGLSTAQFAGVALPYPLDSFGFPGCVLQTSIEAAWPATTGNQGINAGYAFADIPFAVPATGNGTWTLSAQWAVLGTGAEFPGGWTQAIRWRR